jgi:hypothetical protein
MITHENGVLVLAYGDKYYLRAAWMLLCSIRAFYPGTKVHLEIDNSWTLSDSERQIMSEFDSTGSRIRFTRSQIYQPKVELDRFSPFTERTLYMDADALMLPPPFACDIFQRVHQVAPGQELFFRCPINKVYVRSSDKEVGNAGYTYHGDPKQMIKYHEHSKALIEFMPQCSTGFLIFDKRIHSYTNAEDTRFFATVREIFYDQSAPAFSLPEKTGRADEYAYNVAIALYGRVPNIPWMPVHFHRTCPPQSIYFMRKSYLAIQLGGNTLPDYVQDISREILDRSYNFLSMDPDRRIYPEQKKDTIPYRKGF